MQKKTQITPGLPVDELAALAQQGNKDARDDLWQRVKAWAFAVALRYKGFVQDRGAWSVDDLKQCAALGVLEAVKTYQPQKGAFTSWCAYYVHRQCASMLGLVGQKYEDLPSLCSLDAPVPGVEDLTLLDTLEDPSAEHSFEAADNKACNEVLRQDLERSIAHLPGKEGYILHWHDLEGMPLADAGREIGQTEPQARQTRKNAIRHMRQDRTLRELYTPNYWRHKGLAAFKSSLTSIVEEEAIRHIERS